MASVPDPVAEALRLVALTDELGHQVRVMGGLAFHVRCPDWTAPVARARRDIDLATRSVDRKALASLLVSEGYVPDRHYNALYGHRQLYFIDPAHNRPVDVIVDRLDMCHVLTFAERLSQDSPTLPLSELLLSKLQIVKINRKDVLDILALVSEHPLTEDDVGINRRIITNLTSSDWGWWRTVIGNLEQLLVFLDSDLQQDELDFSRPPRLDAKVQLLDLKKILETTPKSMRWRVRARIGERMSWFAEPEEVAH